MLWPTAMLMEGELKPQAFIETCCALKIGRAQDDEIECWIHGLPYNLGGWKC